MARLAGELARHDCIFLAHLVLDKRVPDAGHARLAAVVADGFADGPAAAEVVEDGGAAAAGFAEDVHGDQGGEEVHRDDLALVVDEAAAVGIAVERRAEVGSDLDDFLADGVERAGLERVGEVVREGAVERVVHRDDLEEVLDAGEFIESHGVRVVDHDFELAVHLRVGTQEFRVFGSDVVLRDRALFLRGGEIVRLDEHLDVRDAGVAADRDRLRLAELEAVPFARIVRRRDHHAAVRAEESVGVVGHRSGAEADVDHVRALFRDAAGEAFEQRGGVRTHVASHDDLLRAGEDDECAPDLFCEIGVDLLRVNAADVVGFENSRHGYAPHKWLNMCAENGRSVLRVPTRPGNSNNKHITRRAESQSEK